MLHDLHDTAMMIFVRRAPCPMFFLENYDGEMAYSLTSFSSMQPESEPDYQQHFNMTFGSSKDRVKVAN